MFLDKTIDRVGLSLSRRDRRRRCPIRCSSSTGVSKSFGPVIALDRVDLTIGAAEAVGLIGDNGAGKSTLVKILSGVYPPSAGTIRFDGAQVDIRESARRPRRRASR